jgi:hypothetical protein
VGEQAKRPVIRARNAMIAERRFYKVMRGI